MDGLHVGRGGHSIDLTRKVDPETGQLGVLEATLETHAKERGAMTLAVDSVTPMLAKGAVGSSSSGKLLLVAGVGSSCSEDARLLFIGVSKDSERGQTRAISTLPVARIYSAISSTLCWNRAASGSTSIGMMSQTPDLGHQTAHALCRNRAAVRNGLKP